MAKYSIHAGHNSHVTGAHGVIKEEVVDRQIKNATIKYLKAAGQTVYDDTDDAGLTQNQNLANIVKKINSHPVDLAVSIHLNAGHGTGIEVFQYDDKTDTIAGRIVANLCKVTGLVSRGVKKNQSLYVLRKSKPQALLVECGFVDTDRDADFVGVHTDAVGKAIAEGIIGKTITAPKPAKKPAKVEKKSVPYPGHLIKLGSGGSTVELVQKALGIKADGIFGKLTKSAVKSFQKKHKLVDDGVVGPATWKALFN